MANDRVVDSLIALLESVRRWHGDELPVAVVPFDERIAGVKRCLTSFDFARLHPDPVAIRRWDAVMDRARPDRRDPRTNRLSGCHRKLVAFDGPFERFVVCDADVILLSPLDSIWEHLEENDLVSYDYQYKEPQYVYDLDALERWLPREAADDVFCAGFFASRRGLFAAEALEPVLVELEEGARAVFKPSGAEQPLINYLVQKFGLRHRNLAKFLPQEERVGNAVTSTHFRFDGETMWDGERRLLYLHYVGVSGEAFREAVAGLEPRDLPYADVFLHYRFAGGRPRWTETMRRRIVSAPRRMRRRWRRSEGRFA